MSGRVTTIEPKKRQRFSAPLISQAPEMGRPSAAFQWANHREPVDIMETTGSGLSARKTVWIKGGLSEFLGSSTSLFRSWTAITLEQPSAHKPQRPVILRTLDSQKNTLVSACRSFCDYDLCTVYICIHICDIGSLHVTQVRISHVLLDS